MHEDFMQSALEIARQSLDTPGALPYGAVVVKDGVIVGKGLNQAPGSFDPTSHGEVEAIRDACKRLGTTDLTGCDLYTTSEPCSMCVATMYITGIARVFYASAAPESAQFFERLSHHDPSYARRIPNDKLREQVGTVLAEREMPAEQVLETEAHRLFDAYAKRLGV